MAENYEGVWVFNGEGRFAGGVFTTLEDAEEWIGRTKLSGVLTLYPLDIGVHDWAVTQGSFTPTQDKHSSPEFIGSFTTASMAHHHYEHGKREV